MAFRQLFDKYYFGNPNCKDYGVEDQPHTRKELFKAVFDARKGNLLLFSLVYALPWMPAIVWSLIVLLSILSVANATELFEAEQIQSIVVTYTLIMVPLVTITGPFNLAASYVMRNWARDQHADLSLDYRDALKENWKQGLMFGFTNGILIPVAWFFLSTYLIKGQTHSFYYLPIGLILVILLLWQLCCIVIPTMCVTYNLPYRHIVRNAIIISCSQLFRANGIWLISMVVPILATALCFLNVSNVLWVVPVVAVYKVLFGFGLNRLIFASYANMVCEKYINSRIDGAPTDIGLH